MNAFIKLKISLGQNKQSISMLPPEIAEIMGHDDVIRVFNSTNPAAITNSGLASFSPFFAVPKINIAGFRAPGNLEAESVEPKLL